MTRLASLAIGVFVGIIGWWAVSTFLASPPPAPAPTDAGRAAKPPDAAPPLAAPERADGPAARAARESEAVDAPAAAHVATGPKLRGTIVGVDAAGVEQRQLDGAFLLRWLEGKEARSLAVTVRGGRFESDAPPAATLVVDNVVLGERLGRLADQEVAIPQSGEVALRVDLLPASSLRVVDAATRAELDGVEVWRDLEPERGPTRLSPRLEDDAVRVVAGTRSPVVLPPVDATQRYWIHVKGYAWSTIEVQHLVGGEREVPLIRGGGLTIRFLRKPERDDLELSVRNATTAREFSAAIVAAERELVDVDPGHYVVRATIAVPTAASLEPRTVVAEAELDVVAGATVQVVLPLGDVPSLPKVAKVPFRGLVVGSDARVTMALSGRLSSADPVKRVQGPNRFVERMLAHDPARAGEWTFDFGMVVPGRMLVTIQPLQVHHIFEVGGDGLVDARIDLPALGEVEVAVADAQTGAAIGSAGVTWRAAGHPLADDDLPQSAPTRGDPPVARLLAPLGSITVSCWPEGYSIGEHELEVLASLQRVTLKVRREQYVRVLFRQGSSVVPIDPGSMEFVVADAEGKNHQVGWAKEVATGALRLILDQPGEFTVRLPKLAGFKALADQPVRVEYGGTVELAVDLVLE